jgi:hypothetical protein
MPPALFPTDEYAAAASLRSKSAEQQSLPDWFLPAANNSTGTFIRATKPGTS